MSVWKSNKYTDKLTVRVIDRDQSTIGRGVVDYLVSPSKFPLNKNPFKPNTDFQLSQKNLGYFPTSPESLPTTQSIEHDIVQEGAWATVEIIQGATSLLEVARANGNAGYNGSELIQVYYAQARNELASGNYLVPYLQQALGRITGELGIRLSAQ